MALRTAQHAPSSTYRVQLRPENTFDDVAQAVPYLARLGISHVYLSPILQPVAGSLHGYDVVDHSVIAQQLGGAAGLERLAATAQSCGIGLIADVVPNHMAVPTPCSMNPALWSVLRDGPESPYAQWFDVDWSGEGSAMLMPILGAKIGTVIAHGELVVDHSGPEAILRYFDHEFPVRAGTEQLAIADLIPRQWYRLSDWKIAQEELNYRRFFDVDTLAAVRVEDPEVFTGTHRTLLDLVHRGVLDGLRIDHPDGLANPADYLARLTEQAPGSWVVVEKILEADEALPSDWACHGTTGYDALMRVGGLFEHAAHSSALQRNWRVFTGCTQEFSDVVDAAKRTVINDSLHSEVARLVELLVAISRADVRLWDHSRRGFTVVLTELLVAFDRYRAYVVPGEVAGPETEAVVVRAAEQAQRNLDSSLEDTLDLVCKLVLGHEVGTAGRQHEPLRAEFSTRFQQTCGPVMAKGVEDTACYRWFPYPGRNEVGGCPDQLGFSPDAFHAYAQEVNQMTPLTMTTLTTHDTKRSEDVRAVLAALTEIPDVWFLTLTALRDHAESSCPAVVDPPTEYLLWHTVVGTASGGELPQADRVVGYFEKACREAKVATDWVNQNDSYEHAVAEFVRWAVADPHVAERVAEIHEVIAESVAATVLGQKLIQLTMPGVPDVYQGTEVLQQTLVDPDNRALVDFSQLAALLARSTPVTRRTPLSEAKLRVVQQALRLRRQFPAVFTSTQSRYVPVATSSQHAVAFQRVVADRPTVVPVATRLAVTLAHLGGWGDHTLMLPAGRWLDVLTDREHPGGAVRLADLLADCPVALLVHHEQEEQHADL